MGAEARERNLTLMEFLGVMPAGDGMRQRLHVAKEGFHALLVGKDGDPSCPLSSLFPQAS